MRINMSAAILGLDDKPIHNEDGSPIILRTIVQGALLASLPEDKHLGGPEKARMFDLALKANKEFVDWKAEDIAFVKARIGMTSTPLAVGRCFALLDKPARRLAGDDLHP